MILPPLNGQGSSLRVVADARIELLGLIQRLAGFRRRGGPAAADWQKGVDSRFRRWRRHRAVESYRRAMAERGGGENYGLILLFLTDPPRLKWKYGEELVSGSFIRRAGGGGKLERFLRELRDFALRARFMPFYRENKSRFDLHRRQGEKKLAGRDCMGILERYVGLELRCRYRIIWPLLYSAGDFRSYIIPYPYRGPGVTVSGPFEVFTIAAQKDQEERWPLFLWAEPLYIPIEKIHAEQRRGACEMTPGDKRRLVSALGWRLTLQAFSGTQEAEPGSSRKRMNSLERALCRRLEEYENNRRLYPNLSSFYPRLLETLRSHG